MINGRSDQSTGRSDQPEHTFLFADLAGFTALTEAHGDHTAADLAEEFCTLAREELTSYEAEEVKTLGDAIMLRVEQPGAAVQLGLKLAGRVAEAAEMPVLRVGMHTGPAVERDGDWFGGAVNLAARVAAAAGGDEVLLTDDTRKAAGGLPEIELESLGPRSFRNVAGRISLFRALPDTKRGPFDLDPVCRMTVDPARAAGRLKVEGETFYFCSLECAAAFAGDPGRFVAEPPGSDGPAGAP